MKFTSIVSQRNVLCPGLLLAACRTSSVEYSELHIEDEMRFESFSKDTFIYRVSDDPRAILLEQISIAQGAKSFYRQPNVLSVAWDNVFSASLLHQECGIPVPRTIFTQPKGAQEVKAAVEYLGGFPVILKVIGGQKGVGVIKVDSLNALLSLQDYLYAQKVTFILREYIESGIPPASYRAVVVGDEVIFAYKNQSIEKDEFRSNVNQSERVRTQVDLQATEQEVLVRAVHVLNLNVGAVDFLYRPTGEIAVLEVNFPFNFSPIVKTFSFPIHEKLVEYALSN